MALEKGAMSRSNASDRNGQVVLFLVFLSLLAGRFTLRRLAPGLPDIDLRWITLATCLLAFLGWVAVEREMAVPLVHLHGLTIWLLFWSGWMALSGLWADPPARVTAGVVDFSFLAAFVLLAVAVATRLSREAASAIWTWMLLAGLVYFAGAMAGPPGAQGRYSAFGGGPNVFVRVMVLAALGAVFLAAARRRVLFLLTLPPLLLGAVLSGSRGGLLAGLVVVLLGGASVLKKLPRGALALSVIGAGLTLILVPKVLGTSTQEALTKRFVQQTVEQRYASDRGDILTGAIKLFEMHPFAGAGLDGYYADIGHTLGYDYPHNFVVASAAEGGLVGLILLLVAIWQFVSAARHQQPMPSEALFLLLAGGFVLFAGMFSGDYYDSRLAWFFLGLAAVEGRRHVAEMPSGPSSREHVSRPAPGGGSSFS
jgi:O-antigen ligase